MALVNQKISIFLLALATANIAQAEVKFDPALRAPVQNQQEEIPVIVLLEDAQLRSPKIYEQEAVINYLKIQSELAWQKVSSHLSLDTGTQEHLKNIEVHWINNSFSATTDREGLRLLARTPGVKKVYLNGEVEYQEPIEAEPDTNSSPARRELPYDLKDIELDQIMKRRDYRDVTGAGVTVGMVDTGVDGTHPFLQGKIKAFFDGRTNERTPNTVDRGSSGHGTHVAGTILGGDRRNNVIGVAPGAKLVAAASLLGYEAMLKGMEFMLDPDGNPRTKDAPALVSNSWHTGYAPDQELFYKAISAWEAAGIVPVFSAGNAGPGDGTITHPKEHPATVAVGATGEDGKVTSFSSRGPGTFRGKTVNKPDLTAPGNNIVSSAPKSLGLGGDAPTQKMSGTSMAAPHVAGAIALMLEVAPRLKPRAIRRLLVNSSIATNEDGTRHRRGLFESREWNKIYGYGKLNVWNAVRYAAREEARRQSFFGGRFRSLYDLTPEVSSVTDRDMTEDETAGDTTAKALEFPAELEGNEWLSAETLLN